MYSSYMCLYCQIYRETYEGGILTSKTSYRCDKNLITPITPGSQFRIGEVHPTVIVTL